MMAPIDGYNRGASTRTVNYRRARMTDGPVTYFPFFQQPLKPRPFKAGCQQSQPLSNLARPNGVKTKALSLMASGLPNAAANGLMYIILLLAISY